MRWRRETGAEEPNVELQRENAERVRVQAALQASVSQVRLVTGNLPIFIAYCDAKRFRFVNQPSLTIPTTTSWKS